MVEHSWRLWLPSGLTEDIISKAHDPPRTAHGGMAKTLHRVRQYFYWPNMTVQIRHYVAKYTVLCVNSVSPHLKFFVLQ